MLYGHVMTQGFKHFIVLSGEAGAGKDSVANILVEKHGYEKFSLSDEMKRFCKRVFGWSDDQLWGPSHFRNEPDPKWARPCSRCDGSGTNHSFPIQGCSACEGEGTINDNSPRRVLQLLGDEWARQMIHPDIWTLSSKSRIESLLADGKRLVVNDARFHNDRWNLAMWFGAKRVDVRQSLRKQKVEDNQRWRMHASEQDRPDDDFVEYIINNDEEWPFVNLAARVEEMLITCYP